MSKDCDRTLIRQNLIEFSERTTAGEATPNPSACCTETSSAISWFESSAATSFPVFQRRRRRKENIYGSRGIFQESVTKSVGKKLSGLLTLEQIRLRIGKSFSWVFKEMLSFGFYRIRVQRVTDSFTCVQNINCKSYCAVFLPLSTLLYAFMFNHHKTSSILNITIKIIWEWK